MDKLRRKFLLLFFITFIFFIFFTVRTPRTYRSIPKPRGPSIACPLRISEESITRLNDTKHLLVSAYMDQRVKGFDMRIIGMFKRDSIRPLYCLFCCAGWLSTTTPATTSQHSDNFGFPFVTTDVMCPIPENCKATHVSLLTKPDTVGVFNQPWLPIRNKKKKENKLQFDFTVCVSNLFGGYNNVLQYAQTLEMYRLLGVNRVVIYNTSCGPDLDRLLRSYSQEGFVEIVPWPIDQHLHPSRGWLFSRHGGDVHYFGQLATLNECVYRSMDRSRYVLLNDIDEIVMPYRHDNLKALMDTLQKQHRNVGVFLIENHRFPKMYYNESLHGRLARWNGVPGFNILENIYREDVDRKVYHPYKMILQPSSVEQTSVHAVLKRSGGIFKVPADVCRIVHSQIKPTVRRLRRLHLDTRLWDFGDKLSPRVSGVLRRAGLLSSEEQS